MDQSSTFARHFSRLVWLLMHESGSVDEQKMSLRACVQASKVGAVELATQDNELRAGDDVLPSVLTGVQALAAQMTAHSMPSLHIAVETGPAELLGLARTLAARSGEEATLAEPVKETSPPTPTSPTPAVAAEAVPEPVKAAAPRPSLEARKVSEASAALLAQLSGRAVTTLSPEELLDGLDKTAAANDVDPTTKLLDDIVTLAEHSARAGKPKVVVELLHGTVVRHSKLKDGPIKAQFVLAIRRLAKPALLRSVAGLIIKSPEMKQVVYDVLQATAEDGAEAVIEQVGQAKSAEERKSLVELLVELKDAVPALIRMLGDSRWFVVRNAADLLGEMVATKAEDALVNLLRHTDDRVRRSATAALLKLGTPDAVKGVYEAVNDQSPEVRMQAAASMSTRKDSKTSATLIRAIEGESDGDVQLAMIAALGKVATPDAVQKLVKLAEPETRMFRKKDSTLRVAAVMALADARSPAALNALKELAEDKDKEVRETATRALAQAGR